MHDQIVECHFTCCTREVDMAEVWVPEAWAVAKLRQSPRLPTREEMVEFALCEFHLREVREILRIPRGIKLRTLLSQIEFIERENAKRREPRPSRSGAEERAGASQLKPGEGAKPRTRRGQRAERERTALGQALDESGASDLDLPDQEVEDPKKGGAVH